MQKPKPTPGKIALGSILRFRAARLLQDSEKSDLLHATNHIDMLEPQNVVAMLDCESDTVNEGKISITEESTAVILKMDAVSFQQPSALPLQKKKKQVPKIAKKGKTVQNMIKKRAAKASAARANPKMEKKVGVIMEKGESICAEDIRRSASGRAAIQTVMNRFRCMDALKFSQDPVFDQRTNLCCLPGLESVHWKVFLSKAPKYFEAKFALCARRPEIYGEKVFQDLVVINRGFLVEPTNRDKWKQLVHAVSKVGGAGETL
eukprot:Skav231368  [mRNA]  locus=scaffold1586:584328:585113:+ [translate_table: standard]